ncbi:MAG: S8 family serine peptidase [Burkholderiaceae bacterium]
MDKVLGFFFLLLTLAGSVSAQQKIRIEKADDLPRFSYPISGPLEDVVRDDAKFEALAGPVRRDIESIFDQYEIADKATARNLFGVLAQLDYLQGKYDAAIQRLDAIRSLEEKPADKLLSGLRMRAMIAAVRSTDSKDSEAYRTAVAQNLATTLQPLPYEVIGNSIREYKASAEIASEALALGRIQNVLQPTVDKAGALSSDLVPAIIGARYFLVTTLPLKKTLVDTYGSYLTAHVVSKPDIWAARNVALPAGKYHPVNMVVWDSGVDLSLFPGRQLKDPNGQPAVIGFDRYAKAANTELLPVSDEVREALPKTIARIKGISDLQANIDSPEATELKTYLSTLTPANYKHAIEELNRDGQYVHGTHVAGIATAGNPYARIGVARIEFGYTLLPDPCPSDELERAQARNLDDYVKFMRQHHVRVVNMSWGGSIKDDERALELCSIGKTTDERKAIARRYFDIERTALTRAMAKAKEILFVASAGNSNEDASFSETIPAGIELPNLITVGAVDQAGDEASFTSYGKTVVVDANGYLVDSLVPGGEHVPLSGTSMASPQVANLAGKLLAIAPKLTPEQVIGIIRRTSDPSGDGRRHLINPAKAIAEVARSH